MTNEELISGYEKLVADQAEIIKGYQNLVKALPPTPPKLFVSGLLGETQDLVNKLDSTEPKDEQERKRLVGAKIKLARQMLGLKRNELAEKMKVSVPLIAAYEQGTREPSIKNLVSLTRILNTSADWLLGIPTPTLPKHTNGLLSIPTLN